jgi:hypothetical protein
MSNKRTIRKPRPEHTDVVVSLHVTGEPTDGWCAEVAQLLVDLVGPWQALANGGVRRRGRGGRELVIASGNANHRRATARWIGRIC